MFRQDSWLGWLVKLLPWCLFACAAPARAQDTEPPEASAPAETRKGWEFATVTYVWLAGVEGEADVIGPIEPVGVDLSLGDVIDSFKFAFMGAAEAKHGRLIVLGDLTFIHLEANKGIDIRNQNFLDAELDTRTIDVTVIAGYRVIDQEKVSVDLFGGVRTTFFKTSLDLVGPNQQAEGSVSETWFDPIVSARVNVPLGGRWSASVFGDVGGFGIASDVTWQGIATLDYKLNKKLRLQAGWRHYKVDYDKGDFLYDVRQSGLFLAARYQF